MSSVNVLGIVTAVAGLAWGAGWVSASRVGKGPDDGCPLIEATDRCAGFWRGDVKSAEFVEFIRAAKMLPLNPVAVKRTTVQGTTRETTIQSTLGSSRAAFRRLKEGSLVIGRMDTDPNGDDDPLYGMGRTETTGYARSFFLVLESIQIPKREALLALLGKSPSVSLGTYGVYGIDATGAVKRIKQGKLKWCAHSHTRSGNADSASFVGCEYALKLQRLDLKVRRNRRLAEYPSLQKALNDRSIHDLLRDAVVAGANVSEQQKQMVAEVDALLSAGEAKELKKMLRESPSAPAWITCGTGCCTLESDS